MRTGGRRIAVRIMSVRIADSKSAWTKSQTQARLRCHTKSVLPLVALSHQGHLI